MRVNRILLKGTSTATRAGPRSIEPGMGSSMYSLNNDSRMGIGEDDDEVRRVDT